VLAACSAARRAPEPGTILVRNHSGADLQVVSLHDVRDGRVAGSGGGGGRMGAVSPVPRGVTQRVGRASDPPPFPAEVELRWTLASGETRSQRIAMDAVLAGATGAPGEVLVLELLPDGTARAVVEAQ
jgi:hypothetical protein